MSGRIVVVNFTRFGDVLQSGPLLAKLKAAHPAKRMTVLALDAFAEVAARLPVVDNVVALRGDELMAALDQRGNLSQAYARLCDVIRHPDLYAPELLVNLSHTPLSATLCGLLDARETLGLMRRPGGRLTIYGDWFAYLLSIMQDRRANPFNLVEIYARIFEPHRPVLPLGFDVQSADREAAAQLLKSADIDIGKPFIVLQPGASTPSRQWPRESFAQLAVHVRQHGWQTIIAGSGTETDHALTIERLSTGAARSIAGRTTLGSLAAVLTHSRRLISNDTGTIHLAAALGVPAVGIYIGPAAAKDTAPYGEDHFILEPDLPCAPCGYHDNCSNTQCREQITVEHVLPLVLLPPERAGAAAAEMRGVRVYRTSRGAAGAAVLTLLNRPATGAAPAVLDYFRDFWTRLLDDNVVDANPNCPPLPENIDLPVMSEASDIAAQAESAQNRIESRLQPNTPATDLPDLLRDHLIWQDRLRTLADKPSAVAPLARFILVQAGAVRADSLDDYLKDMRRTITLLQRGVELLQNAGISKAQRPYRHAPA